MPGLLRRWRSLAALLLIGGPTPDGFAQAEDLSAYFGFEPLEIVKVGRRAGPIATADLDGDGRQDLVVVNNHDSRIELHYQRPDARPEDASPRQLRPNEFPEHWRFRREFVSVTHRISAIVPVDFDGDGRLDLLYAGLPAELVFVRQTHPGVFAVERRHRVKSLAATRDGLAVADVLGDAAPEVLAVVEGSIRIWPLRGGSLGAPTDLAAGESLVAFLVDDLDGDGRLDIAGIIPDDPAPVRIWFGDLEDDAGELGPQVRFELPPLVDAATVRLPGETAAYLGVIERPSKRILISRIATEQIEQTGDRDAAFRVHGFADAGNRDRSHTVGDVDGDGLLDLVVTDTSANALVTYYQRRGYGFQTGEPHPSLSNLTYVAAANVDSDGAAELFVLSEKEGVVGRCEVVRDADGTRTMPFPRPVHISPGHTPTALAIVQLETGPRAAVVAKDGREYVVDLIDLDGGIETIELGKLSKSPETIVALDADQDGRTDLLLFTRDKPMTMLKAGEDGFTLTESKDMGQFGLVKAARAENIAIFDIDGDDRDELLIADQNYIRAVRYDLEPAAGVSPGWQVVAQINARDRDSRLVSLAVLDDRIVAADTENDRLVVMAPEARAGDRAPRWREVESLTVRGFSFSSIHAGAFTGDERESILAVGEEGFAVVRLAGERTVLREVASWRSADDRRLVHELASGDVNNDGFTDLVALDAGEQMCELFTFTESHRLLHVMGFQVFESRLFSGGESREYEPSQAIVADVTGDGADDLLLLAHDRVLIYPQMTAETGSP